MLEPLLHLIARELNRLFESFTAGRDRDGVPREIRLTNWNKALAPVGLIGLFIALAVITVVGIKHSKLPDPGPTWPVVGGTIIIVLGLAWWFAVQILWVSLGDEIWVRRPLGIRRYAYTDVVAWGFREPPRSIMDVAEDVPEDSIFVLQFSDRKRFERLVNKRTIQRITEHLTRRQAR